MADSRLSPAPMPPLSEFISFAKRYWIAIAVVLIAVVLVIAYVAGYRISTGLTVVRVGTLEISQLPGDATVYIDYGARGTSSTGTMRLPLMPGNHTVIVSEASANPWETIAAIETNKTTSVDPILVPLRPTVTALSATDTASAVAAFKATKLPSPATPLVLGCAAISVEQNHVVADVATTTPGCAAPSYECTDGSCAPTIVFSPLSAIENVVAYPGRTDAVLVAAGSNLYAVGLDPRTPQTFVPLLSAPDVSVADLGGGRVVVKNATGVYALSL